MKLVETIIAVVATTVVAWITCAMIIAGAVTDAGRMALAKRQDIHTKCLWRDIYIEFETGPYANFAVYRGQVINQDINKSRIAGKVAKQKTREFIKGWLDGEPSKHSD